MGAAGAGVGAGVLPGTRLGVSSKGNEASALREGVEAADASKVVAIAEISHTDALEVAVEAEARVVAGAAAGAGKGARIGPPRRGAKAAEIKKKVTREDGT